MRRGELADRALLRLLEDVPPRERAFTHELVYGTLRWRGRLDHLLAQLVRRRLEALEPDLLDILRLGAYQLLELGGVPAYAAVSEAVELARAAGGRGAAGLANAVLQNLRRKGARLGFPDAARDPVGWLAAWGSHPRWLVERWIGRFGAEAARELIEANNRRPEVYLRPIGLAPQEAAARLGEAGLNAEPVPRAPDALLLLPPATAAQALAVVPAVVQDPAAALVVRYAALPPRARIADLCAAPGGKALGLAAPAAAPPHAPAPYVVAADVSPERLGRLRQNLARLPGLHMSLVAADARRPPFRPLEAVLLDVPCTGTGTLRRHPDGKWRVQPADLAALAALQLEILEAAAAAVAPGGVLVYSTCSLEVEENEQQVDAFLVRHPEFRLAPPLPGTVPGELLDPAGRLLVWPPLLNGDGAFAARLERRG